MMTKLSAKHLILMLLLATALGCSEDDDDDESSEGTYPDFSALMIEVLPSYTDGSADLFLGRVPVRNQKSVNLLAVTPSIPDASSYADDWEEQSTQEADLFNAVLNTEGSVKSVFVVLDGVSSRVASINDLYSDENGNENNCTAIDEGTALTIPFISSSDEDVLDDWNDSGKYKCYVEEDETYVFFGRHEISNPAADCTDPYEYYVMAGASSTSENTDSVGERGTEVTLSRLDRSYYHGCTQDIKTLLVQNTLYSGDVEFSSRSEISGNVGNHTFSLRVGYFDGDKDNTAATPSFSTMVGSGKSRKSSSSDSAANFVIGFSDQNCDYDDKTCSEESGSGNYCIQNTTTSNGSYSPDSDTSNCETLVSAYEELEPLATGDIPHATFDAALSDFGL